MKKLLFVIVTIVLVGMTAFAQSSGSFAGNFNGGKVMVLPTITCDTVSANPCTSDKASFLSADIKMPTGKSLLIQGSLETSLLTDTSIATLLGTTNGKTTATKTTAAASGSIVVEPVLTDQNGNQFAVYPKTVTYDSRVQQLSGTLGMACVKQADGTITCDQTQDIELLLSTMGAHSFQFIAPNLPQGVYSCKFNIYAATKATADSVSASANVAVGVRAGSLGVMVVQVQTPFNSLSYQE